MIRIEFTAEAIEVLRYERFHHPHPLVQKKCEALLLKACNISTVKIAEILSVTQNTVRNYCHEYLSGGIESLKIIRYKGQSSELLKHQFSIEEEFRQNPPATVSEAAARIEKLTGIRRELTQTRQFMKRLGLKYRKTAPVPAKADADKQEEFKKNSSNRDLSRPKMAGGWSFS
jgi:transposase